MDDLATTIIGLGNRWRRDDGAGPEVARLLARRASRANISVHARDHSWDLLDEWRAGAQVVVIDAARSGDAPGTVHRFDALAKPLPVALPRSWGHSLGLADSLELALVLDRMPSSLVVYAIEGANFEHCEGLTPPVQQAVLRVVEELRRVA